LKRELLRLLREDEEFRLAVAGLVGLESILRELKSLREDHAKRFETIERKLLEHDKRFEAIERKLLEHDKKFEVLEERMSKVEERLDKVEERLNRVEERLDKVEKRLDKVEARLYNVEERLDKVEEALVDHGRRISRLELTLGALAESFYAKSALDDIRREVEAGGERIIEVRRNVIVDGVELDLLVVTESSVYVVEVKVKPKIEDLRSLLSKAKIVAQHYPGRHVVPILAGAYIGREVEERALAEGVKVLHY
ncbi:MAG: hypothetical protein F7B17_06805, partial [Desulfurococcales archaeon]|nr:hypothetical protein [Desulfurococcales archaeon]